MTTFRFAGLDGSNGLNRLAAELAHAADIAPEDVRKVVQKGALNIKNDWRSRWAGLKHLPAVPYSITYDTTITGFHIEAQIGPEHGRNQANMAHFLENEYGSIHSAPRPGGAPALEAERPKYERELEALALRSLGGL